MFVFLMQTSKRILGITLPPNRPNNQKNRRRKENEYDVLVLPRVKAMEKIRQDERIIKFIKILMTKNYCLHL